MSSEDDRAAFIEQVIARTRDRWREVIPEDKLAPYLMDLRVMLFTHPVAMEYVARAMPRQAPDHTEEQGASAAKKVAAGG